MVASDAFSQALTNPLLAAHVFGTDCFAAFGVEEIERTSSFASIVADNVTPGAKPPLATFTMPNSPATGPLMSSDS
jgi:prostaglandin-endoperoxide synthase 2